MESQRIGQMELSESGTSSHHVSYGVLHHGINIPTSSLMNQGSDFDFRELEEAMVLQGIKARNDEAKAALSTGRPAATLEMFPSWPMRFQQTPRGSSKSGGESTDSGSGVNTFCSSKTSEPPQFDTESPISKKASSSDQHHQVFDQQRQQNQLQQQPELMPFDASRTGPSLNQSPAKSTQDKKKGVGSISEKPLDAKTLRRLAQNREAAKKSRLRKKGMFLGCGGTGGNISSGAAMFDMEYGRWLEDDHRMMVELRAGLQAPLSDNELRVMVDGYLSHYDDIFRLKGMVAKTDMLIQQLEPLAEQQIMGMYGLRHSSHQAEEALSQGLEQLQQSLVETIAGGPVVDGVQQMMVAMGKLSNLEGFLRQADNLRQQSLHQICRLLTIRQVARCFIVIGEYYSRLRALSSLWTSRPRETLMGDDNSCQTTTDMQMVQASQNHFQSF
ncbi:hypothetical protein TanjilG_23654 [Lupinus angustifolius]|uniref:DOG1 domain-containing protein n=1 Tax=Lupinus angustifolius TaxID=3871 RepID=A0A4P1RA29_LUPAN|nr:hypothetical protein TanjilG_23654 [Lupinus angustifolius]